MTFRVLPSYFKNQRSIFLHQPIIIFSVQSGGLKHAPPLVRIRRIGLGDADKVPLPRGARSHRKPLHSHFQGAPKGVGFV